MKNITITVDEETAALARRHAASRSMSLSRFVGELLTQHLREAGEYDNAMRRFLARGAVKLKRRGDAYPSRDETHERSGIR